VVWWAGLRTGNPFTLDGAGATGAVPMPSARLGGTLRWRPVSSAFVAVSPALLTCKPTSGLADSLAHVSLALFLIEAGIAL
jgi:hypothetical protein